VPSKTFVMLSAKVFCKNGIVATINRACFHWAALEKGRPQSCYRNVGARSHQNFALGAVLSFVSIANPIIRNRPGVSIG
jgi:hypothetical protein